MVTSIDPLALVDLGKWEEEISPPGGVALAEAEQGDAELGRSRGEARSSGAKGRNTGGTGDNVGEGGNVEESRRYSSCSCGGAWSPAMPCQCWILVGIVEDVEEESAVGGQEGRSIRSRKPKR
jgi:hypothetical protein